MTEERGYENTRDSEWVEAIRVLVFQFEGIRMGIDVEQIAGMLDPRDRAVDELSVSSFHEKLSFRNGPSAYVAPMVLLVKDEEGRHGVLIDQPQDIISIKIDSIRPLPPLVEASRESPAVWGVALMEEDMVLLVDLLFG